MAMPPLPPLTLLSLPCMLSSMESVMTTVELTLPRRSREMDTPPLAHTGWLFLTAGLRWSTTARMETLETSKMSLMKVLPAMLPHSCSCRSSIPCSCSPCPCCSCRTCLPCPYRPLCPSLPCSCCSCSSSLPCPYRPLCSSLPCSYCSLCPSLPCPYCPLCPSLSCPYCPLCPSLPCPCCPCR